MFFLTTTERPDFTRPIIIYTAKVNETPVGTLELFNIDTDNHKAEFGLSFPVKPGLACIAARMFLRKAFTEWGINRIYSKVLCANERAIGIALRSGFEKEGIEKESLFRDGQYHDIFRISLLKRDFEERWGL